jgi:hypothetical protein
MNQRSVMATQAATMVVVMVAFVFSRIKRLRGEDEPIVYGPRAIADEHRHKNLCSFTTLPMQSVLPC